MTQPKYVPLGIVTASALAALVISILPTMSAPPQAQIASSSQELFACAPVGEGELIAASNQPFEVIGKDKTVETTEPVKRAAAGIEQLRGTALFGGTYSGGFWSECQRPSTEGVVAFLDAKTAELRLTNPDASPAIIDLTIFGTNGEVQGLGARGIQLAPGESRPVAISVIAEGSEGPLAVRWKTSAGRVIAQATTFAPTAYVAPTMETSKLHTLPGVGAGGKAVLVIANLGDDRINGTATFQSASSSYTPTGGDDISVPARSVRLIDVSGGTGGGIGTIRFEGDGVTGVTLFSGKDGAMGAAIGRSASTQWSAYLPAGAVQVTNPQDAPVEVSVQGTKKQTSVVQPGTTVSIDAGAGLVKVSAKLPVFVAGVVESGKAIIPFADLTVGEPIMLNVERDLRLR